MHVLQYACMIYFVSAERRAAGWMLNTYTCMHIGYIGWVHREIIRGARPCTIEMRWGAQVGRERDEKSSSARVIIIML